MNTDNLPDWSTFEGQLVAEVSAGVEMLCEAANGEPLAAVVLWASPYEGCYELLADTVARHREGARARNRQWAAWLAERGEGEEEWKTARTMSLRTQALDHDPRYAEFAFAEDPVHAFEIRFDAFVRSPRYAELNEGGEDGWLEGHARFAITRALLRLAREGAFDALPREGPLRIGYAYTDSSDAIFVALLDGAGSGASP
jgi:hypothetical protein